MESSTLTDTHNSSALHSAGKLKDSDQKPNTLQLIQVLRAIACLLVVFFHTSINSKEKTGHLFLFDFFEFGGAGVDIFFVISGFIIAYTTLSKPSSIGNYLKKRFIRVYPSYWIVILFFILLQFLLPQFYKNKFPFSLSETLKTFSLWPDHFMVNGVSWSLTNEVMFYLLFCITFLIKNRKILLGILFLWMGAILIQLLNISFTSQVLLYLLFPMNLEFCLGVLVLVLLAKGRLSFVKPVFVFGWLAFLVSGVFTNFGDRLLEGSFNRVILFGLPSFLIVYSAARYNLQSPVKVPKFLLNIGDASYSLYLLHLPFMVAVCTVIKKAGIHNPFLIHIVLFASIVTIVCISIVFYKRIEKPLIRQLNKF